MVRPRRPHAWRAPWLLLACALGACLLTGCNPVTRYKVLTFFFTGVPPMGEEEKDEEETQVVVARVEKKRSVVVQATRYTHGPYASNQCFLCHETSASGGFRGFGKKQEAAKAGAGQVSGKLVAPVGELCAGCHESKSVASAYQAGLWVHGPVSTGYCVLCHGPHAGPEPYMLLKKADALCTECHAEGLVSKRAEHQEMRDCLKCHNAHLGRDSRLLRAEYREVW